MTISRFEWQEESMEIAIKKLGKTYPRVIRLQPDNNVNFVVNDWDDTRIWISRFAPRVRLIGPGLWRERFGITQWFKRVLGLKDSINQDNKEKHRNIEAIKYRNIPSWGGVYTRVLEKADRTWRCVQYLYIYTRQKGAISLFWNVLIPLLMMGWLALIQPVFSWETDTFLGSLFSGEIWSSSNFILLIPLISIIFVTAPLLSLSVRLQIKDKRESEGTVGFRFRATTMLIPYSLLMYLGLFYNLFFWVLFVMAVVFAVFWGLEFTETLPTSHKMDYVPIFVWAKRKKNSRDQWEQKYVTWDYVHYIAKTAPFRKPTRKFPPLERFILRLTGGSSEEDRFLLHMTDTWHALEPGVIRPRMVYVDGMLYLILGIAITIFLFITGLYDDNLVLLFFYGVSAYTLIPGCFSWIGCRIMRSRSDLIPQKKSESPESDEDYKDNPFTNSRAELTHDKLVELWNLREPYRLKIMTKLQDPFRYFEEIVENGETKGIRIFDNFNVELNDLLALIQDRRSQNQINNI